ncbi:hypothetical protein, partial [Bacillus subtilis]
MGELQTQMQLQTDTIHEGVRKEN